MKTNNTTNAKQKTRIYNLIILDESGSMMSVTKQTIDGCNETINVIKSAQSKFAETQENLVSIYCFQSDNNIPSRYLIKNVPAEAALHVQPNEYRPWGSTPLYDAIGECIADLKHTTGAMGNAIGSITIITDGMENSSTHYTRAQVSKMISEVKELGWNVNFIGANIDAKATAMNLNIDNHLQFDSDSEGTKAMFDKECKARVAYYERIDKEMSKPLSCSETIDIEKAYRERRKQAAKGFFADPDAFAEE